MPDPFLIYLPRDRERGPCAQEECESTAELRLHRGGEVIGDFCGLHADDARRAHSPGIFGRGE